MLKSAIRGAALAAMLSAGCGGEGFSGGASGAGGDGAEAGGAPMQLAQAGTGGALSAGGAVGAGGDTSTGGAVGSGGSPMAASGGAVAIGGTGAGGAAGSPATGGTAAMAGGAPSTGGGVGSGGAVPPVDPVNCPDVNGQKWTVYTVQPGHCLSLGNTTWSGQNVCTERTPDDGVCEGSCLAFVSVRVDLLGKPTRIAVVATEASLGTPSVGSSVTSASDFQTWCRDLPLGINPAI